MLRIINLSKSYNSKKSVNELSLHVNPGDIYGFIGHNGAGKTTTIKCIAGILDFEQGDILIRGKSIKKEAIACKQILAYIPDSPSVYEYLTGYQYINFICDIYKVPQSELNEKTRKYAAMFEMESSLNNLISSYSHGMKQKLIIIASLVHSPKLLVLDEPFVGLDPVAALELKKIMKALCKEGCAIFFSTHVLEVAEKLCNKIAIIKNGKLVTSGETQKVLANKDLESVFMEVINDVK